MGEESAPECINVYEVRSMWPQTFRLGMALFQMQEEGIQMRMRGATGAVVERQDMPTWKTAKTCHDIWRAAKNLPTWKTAKNLPTDMPTWRAPNITLETPGQHLYFR